MLTSEKRSSKSHQPTLRPTETSTPLKLINATGSNMQSTRKLRKFSDDEDEPEGYDPVPLFSKTFGDAIAEALEQAEKIEEKTGNVLKFLWAIVNICRLQTMAKIVDKQI